MLFRVMIIKKLILLFSFLLIFCLPALSQDNSVELQRSPEQEAVKQTDKLQEELALDFEQAKRVYEINLKYARERQISNTRSEAVERMKNKDAEIERVLTEDQNSRLHLMRNEGTSAESTTVNRNSGVKSNAYRSLAPSTFRSNSSSNTNVRRTYKSVSTVSQPSSTIRSVTPSTTRTSQPENNTNNNTETVRSSVRSSSSTLVPTRKSTTTTTQETRTNTTR